LIFNYLIANAFPAAGCEAGVKNTLSAPENTKAGL
jgi:hypothetical protein